MPDENQIPVSRTFHIEVDQNGKFSFKPDREWQYGRGDHICIHCDLPFTIKFRKVAGVQMLTNLPSLDTKYPNGQTALRDVDTNKFEAHIDVPGRPRQADNSKPIRKFQYEITAIMDVDGRPEEIVHKDKNGSDIC